MSAEHRDLAIDGVSYPFEIRRHPRARRVLLRAAKRSGAGFVLTLPPRQPLGPALRWASSQGEFIRRSIGQRPPSVPFVANGTIPFDSQELTVIWQERGPRTPQLVDSDLHVGGPEPGLAMRVERWLKARALERLSVEAKDMASKHGLSVGRISIGDPKSRWGSCARSGNIRFSWRLICAPAYVRRAVVAHEVAHLAHPNHGRDFHALVDVILGESARPAYHWLRSNGAALHGVGRLD